MKSWGVYTIVYHTGEYRIRVAISISVSRMKTSLAKLQRIAPDLEAETVEEKEEKEEERGGGGGGAGGGREREG